MRTATVAAALASALATGSVATLQLAEPRAGIAPRVVQHDIHRVNVSDPVKRDNARLQNRKRSTVNVPLVNEETLYYMYLTIGTPAQSFNMHIDTGSSDLWANVASSALCKQYLKACEAGGIYSAKDSSTYNYVNSQFKISYADGSKSSGDYVTDTVRFNGISLQNQQFGVAYRSTVNGVSSQIQGIIGIGYPANEAISSGQPYANVPAHMAESGYINSNAYSLWLDDLNANKGSILFGGVDTGKYTGELQTLPIIPVSYGGQSYYTELTIAMTALGANGNTGSIGSNLDIAVVLDSGTSLTYLPTSLVQPIYRTFNAQYDSRQQLAFVDCSYAKDSGTIDFTFSGVTIRVPFSELVIQYGYVNRRLVCILGVVPSNSVSLLGDTFLRSAYVVYDLDANEISLAQTDFNGSGGQVKEITKAGSVPSATVVSNAVTSAARFSGSASSVIIGASGIPGFSGFSSSSQAAAAVARPTSVVGYNLALLGAAGAAMMAL